MVKFMLLFTQPDDPERFENGYNDLLALIERMPDIQRRQVVNVFGSPTGQAPYYRILEVYFADQDAMQQALLSKQGQEAGGQVGTFPPGSVEMIFADVYEEIGGNTPDTNRGAES